MDTDLTYSDATKLAALIRNREVTSVEVVQGHLDRIDAINPKINAIVTRAACALDAAVAADEALAAGATVGPLRGVPFTVKDSIDTADVMTQRGSPIFEGRSPDADATVWRGSEVQAAFSSPRRTFPNSPTRRKATIS